MALDFQAIFRVFSRRESNRKRSLPSLDERFRHRILMLFTNAASGEASHYIVVGDYREDFLSVVRQKLIFHLGRPILSSRRTASQIDDTYIYLLECSDIEFLDFIELGLGQETMELLHVLLHDNKLVKNINAAFDADDLPYQLTEYAWEETTSHMFGGQGIAYRIAHFPQVIFREDQVLHSYAVEPTLQLLSQKGLESANTEFLAALSDYRKGDYGDCLVKCGSAFESTLKLICHKRGWRYEQKDTTAALLKVYFSHSSLDSFFKEPLQLVGTIRNRLSTAHGAGAVRRDASQHIARYAINSTAAAILLVTDEEWK